MQKKSANATFAEPVSALAAAYRATRYQAAWPVADGSSRLICLRVDQPCPMLDDWLDSLGATCWSYLTAVNPGSCRLDEAANATRLAALTDSLSAAGYVFLPGVAVADAGDWPDEPSLLVAGLDCRRAGELALTYGQLAFLSGFRGARATLFWTPESPQSG